MYSRCQKCGKKLTDPESIKRGYGPECWGRIPGIHINFKLCDRIRFEDPETGKKYL